MRLLLVGNYGVGNLGDEALLAYFLSRFAGEEWQIVSAAPRGTDVPRLPCGIRSFLRPWWRTVRAFKSCDAVVFGGGTLFTDIESVHACVLWWLHAKVAGFFGKPVYFAFQGVGPFRTRVGEMLARSAFRHASFFSVRDASSLSRAKSLVKNLLVSEGFDPVFSLLQDLNLSVSPEHFAIIPRFNATEEFFHQAQERAEASGKPAIILSLHPDDPREIVFSQRLQFLLPRAVFRPVRNLRDLAQAVASCGQVYTARYHGAIAALALGVPFEVFSLGEGDKLSTLPSTRDGAFLRALVDAAEEALRGCFAHQVAKNMTH